jgi:hypothetical protein
MDGWMDIVQHLIIMNVQLINSIHLVLSAPDWMHCSGTGTGMRSFYSSQFHSTLHVEF